jgi:hypothetical protein
MPVLRETGMLLTDWPCQEAQVLQLPELHPEHGLPVPGIVLGTPPEEALKQAKVDIFLGAGWWHRGHSPGRSAWLRGRSSSKLDSHSGQMYS